MIQVPPRITTQRGLRSPARTPPSGDAACVEALHAERDTPERALLHSAATSPCTSGLTSWNEVPLSFGRGSRYLARLFPCRTGFHCPHLTDRLFVTKLSARHEFSLMLTPQCRPDCSCLTLLSGPHTVCFPTDARSRNHETVGSAKRVEHSRHERLKTAVICHCPRVNTRANI